MKKIISSGVLAVLFVLGFGSCARYHANALSSVSPELIKDVLPSEGLIIVAKAFSKSECKRYLDRDVISKGYQPVQLYIENLSDKTYLFATQRVNLTLASAEEVAKKVHTSTFGRITGYGAAALVATPLFVIPAVVDGYQSSRSNEALDLDFLAKSAKDQLILPFSHCNMLLFVPVESVQDSFILTLLDEETSKPKRVCVKLKM